MREHAVDGKGLTAVAGDAIAAGVIVYRPDAGMLERLLAALQPQVDEIYLFCNSPPTAEVRAEVEALQATIIWLGDGSNAGLGVGYNQIMQTAVVRGLSWVVLFDQDSTPSPGMTLSLLGRFRRLMEAGQRPSVVGPRPISPDGTAYKTPDTFGVSKVGQSDALLQTLFLISSGSLTHTQAYRDIGPFREDFFIDAIDIEWCMRARSSGYTCWMAMDVQMQHRLGIGLIHLPLTGVQIARQPPRRIYTFVRNQLYLMRLRHIPRLWKLRAVVMICVHSLVQVVCGPDRSAMFKAVLRGWADGLRGKLGPPRPMPRPADQ